MHLDASSHLGLIGTKSVASNSSQQSLVSDGSLLSGGFSKSDRGTNPRGSDRWEGGLGAGGGQAGVGGQVQVAVGGQGAGGDRQVVGAGGGRETIQSAKQGGGDATLSQSTKSSWSISRTTSGPSTSSVDPLRADLDSVLSAVIRSTKFCHLIPNHWSSSLPSPSDFFCFLGEFKLRRRGRRMEE